MRLRLRLNAIEIEVNLKLRVASTYVYIQQTTVKLYPTLNLSTSSPKNVGADRPKRAKHILRSTSEYMHSDNDATSALNLKTALTRPSSNASAAFFDLRWGSTNNRTAKPCGENPNHRAPRLLFLLLAVRAPNLSQSTALRVEAATANSATTRSPGQ